MKSPFLLLTLPLLLLSSCGQPSDNLPLAERRAALPEFEESVWQPLETPTFTYDVHRYLEFLYSYLPLPDMAMKPFNYWAKQVESALKVRHEMGWNVPEKEFRHFVLPPRVNNEDLDDFRTVWADSLCRRVKGMSMYDAVLEINHWCHEQATYKPSDARTSSPLATIATGTGRCGEESVLGVAALRAVGIPARQVYTPRWAHTDDNHAWVEAWVDGKWYFLGACEPEPRLNMAWFNAPVSRAMLLHTRVFGDYQIDKNEDIIDSSPLHTEINVIAGYVPTRRNVVTVLDKEGKPVEGATVEFKIYNYAEFYTVATYCSDAKGQASLMTGKGDLLVWASKDGMFGFAKAQSDKTDVVLQYPVGKRFSVDIDIVPPPENPIPSDATAEERAACAVRFAYEDSLRLAAHAVPAGKAVLEAFRSRHADNPNVETLIASLTEKDRRDVTLEALEDAFDTHARSHTGLGQEDVWSVYRECPRVEREQLRPFCSKIDVTSLPKFRSPAEVWAWTCKNIRVVEDQNPQSLRMAPITVWNCRVCDELNRNIFFVALCRALGFEARIDEVTAQTQYRWQGEWTTVKDEVPAASVTPDNPDVSEYPAHSRPSRGYLAAQYTPQPFLPNPIYYTHFTLSSLNDGVAHLYNFEEGEATEAGTLASWETLLRRPYEVDKGYYLITSGTRLASGAVLAHMEFVGVGSEPEDSGILPDKPTVVPLVMREAKENIAVIGHFDADPLLPYTGRGYYALAIMGEKDEPSVHARGLLDGMKNDFAAWGRPFVELHPLSREAFVTTGGTVQRMALTERVVPEALAHELSTGCSTAFDRLPVIVIADSFGRVVYFSQGYNTSLATNLRQVIRGL
ncbi:MAG: transglutaminase domain-containing protein [Bacteroidaceae bacterium]|nr:transglutaminase domain-containing protein [Bacteroidaceae bacterium]